MSTLQTRSVFYYGHVITVNNRMFDFLEGATPKVAMMTIGDKTLSEFAAELENILTLAGSQEYTVVVDRVTGRITITAPGAFTVITDGPNAGTSGWALAGFNANQVGGVSQVGQVRSGKEYQTQFKMSMYVDLEDSQVLESSAVNQSAQGQVQVISFGEGKRMEANIRLITNDDLGNQENFYSNPTGLEDARDLMKYLINKYRVEFMKNVANRNSFKEVLLESTPEDRDGTAFKLKNMAVDVYQTGRLVFREVVD